MLLLVVLFAACGTHRPLPSPSPSTSSVRANILGKDIHLVAYHNGPLAPEAAPEVAPKSPAHLVVDDCRGLVLFNTPSEILDSEHLTIELDWTETEARSLLILGTSPSCLALVQARIKQASP